MALAELLLLALALSMDAFAVAVCRGLHAKGAGLRLAITTGLWFGGFQAIMPLLGYLLGTTFEHYIIQVDHWVVFALLLLIGGNMIKEGTCANETPTGACPRWWNMLLFALATSIDAMAVGITFALLPDVNIVAAITSIGITTFILSMVGVLAGSLIGAKHSGRATLCGGVVLILIGLKILLEHLGFIP